MWFLLSMFLRMLWWYWVHEIPILQVLTCFFGQNQCKRLCVRLIFIFVTRVQQYFSWIHLFLSSLSSTGLAYSGCRQFVSPHLRNYLTGSSGLSYCSNIPCTYNTCCSGCHKGNRSRNFSRISRVMIRILFNYLQAKHN